MATVRDPNTSKTKYSDDDLRSTLATFETSLLTPTVSGELSGWLEQVQKTWDEASAQIHYHLKHLHPRQYEEISKQDPELLPRIDQLRDEDESIEQHRSQLSQSIGHIRMRTQLRERCSELLDVSGSHRHCVNLAQHPQNPITRVGERSERAGQRGRFTVEDQLAEPLPDHARVAEYTLAERLQTAQIQQCVCYIENQNRWAFHSAFTLHRAPD